MEIVLNGNNTEFYKIQKWMRNMIAAAVFISKYGSHETSEWND